MKPIIFLSMFLWGVCISSCASLKPPTITKNDTIENYQYMYISPTGSVISNSGATFGGQFYLSSESISPSDLIAGILSKEGFIRLPEVKSELAEKTFIVNYGESGIRNIAGGLGGSTREVTITFISAQTYNRVCSCTAEGQGMTEADDVRKAITRCLKALLSKE